MHRVNQLITMFDVGNPFWALPPTDPSCNPLGPHRNCADDRATAQRWAERQEPGRENHSQQPGPARAVEEISPAGPAWSAGCWKILDGYFILFWWFQYCCAIARVQEKTWCCFFHSSWRLYIFGVLKPTASLSECFLNEVFWQGRKHQEHKHIFNTFLTSLITRRVGGIGNYCIAAHRTARPCRTY